MRDGRTVEPIDWEDDSGIRAFRKWQKNRLNDLKARYFTYGWVCGLTFYSVIISLIVYFKLI